MSEPLTPPLTPDPTWDVPLTLTPWTPAEEQAMREAVRARRWPSNFDPLDFIAGALGSLDAARHPEPEGLREAAAGYVSEHPCFDSLCPTRLAVRDALAGTPEEREP